MNDTTTPDSIHIVVANYADDPHPHIDGAYDNEDAANAHKKAIENSNSLNAPIAWKTEEIEIESAVTECPICGADLTNGPTADDQSSVLKSKIRCPDCTTKVPKTFRQTTD